jgi:hypothetical protein
VRRFYQDRAAKVEDWNAPPRACHPTAVALDAALLREMRAERAFPRRSLARDASPAQTYDSTVAKLDIAL